LSEAPRSFLQMVLTLAIAAGGGLALLAIGLPSPWLTGGMVAVAIAAMAGAPVGIPSLAIRGLMVVLGVSIGAGVTPDTLRGVVLWPGSMLVLAVTVAAIVAASTAFLRRMPGYDGETALYASVPGALTAVLATAASAKADVARVAIVQNLRLFILIAVVPSAAGPAAPIAVAQATPIELAILLALGLAGGLALERTRMPAGLLIGAMLPSAALHGMGFIEARLPDPVSVAAFLGLGAYVGLRFRDLSPAALLREAGPALGSFLVTASIALMGALIVWGLLGVPMAEAMLAFAPGALEGMTALAFSLHLDPAYVGAHHLARFLGIAFLLPIVAMWLRKRATPSVM
jgi:membrane AbrB-like protein